MELVSDRAYSARGRGLETTLHWKAGQEQPLTTLFGQRLWIEEDIGAVGTHTMGDATEALSALHFQQCRNMMD